MSLISRSPTTGISTLTPGTFTFFFSPNLQSFTTLKAKGYVSYELDSYNVQPKDEGWWKPLESFSLERISVHCHSITFAIGTVCLAHDIVLTALLYNEDHSAILNQDALALLHTLRQPGRISTKETLYIGSYWLWPSLFPIHFYTPLDTSVEFRPVRLMWQQWEKTFL